MHATVLMPTHNIDKDTWLSLRQKGIGGSDAAAACGLSRWKSPMELWMEKTNQIEPKEPGEAAYWGQVLEPIIREEFTRRTGIMVKPKKAILQHPFHPIMLANVDGLLTDSNLGQGIFEAKTTGSYSAKEWEDKVPEEHYLQLQHYMAVTGFKFSYIAVLIGGNTLRWHLVRRNDEVIDLLIQLESRFWQHVEKNIAPEIDGSSASTQLLNRLYPHGKPQSIVLPREALSLIEDLEKARTDKKAAEERENTASNRLKEILGENDSGIVADRTIRWQTIEADRLVISVLKKEQPDIYTKYTKPSTHRRFSIH